MANPNNLVSRTAAGDKNPDGWGSQPHQGLLLIDDATGFVSAATPTAEIVDAAPVTIGTLTAGMTGTVATGRLTAERGGLYLVSLTCGDFISGNSAVVVIEVFKNGSVIAATAAAGGELAIKETMAGTAVQMSGSAVGVVSLSKGDFIDTRVTSNVGTVTIKNYKLLAVQLSDASPADV